MIFDDLFREFESRYKFVNNFSTGIILDYSCSSLVSYHGAKILLKNKFSKVYHHNILDDVDDFSYRTMEKNYVCFNQLKFPPVTSFFDCIFSSETIYREKNPVETISKFYDLLKDDGILIITSFNKDALNFIHERSRISYDLFSKDDFLKILRTKFSKIDLYSHVLLDKQTSSKQLKTLTLLKNKLRFFLGFLYSKIDKKGIFYTKHLLKYLKTHNSVLDVVLDEKPYVPILHKDEHFSKFFIAVCHKKC